MGLIARRWWALLLVACMSGCGGGLYVGIDGDWWDDPPEVNLVADRSRAAPGQVLRLAAAASDDYGVDRVQFYRVERDGQATWLGSDDRAPYDWDAVMPATSAAEVRFFARAFDEAGQWTDSESVSVTVQR